MQEQERQSGPARDKTRVDRRTSVRNSRSSFRKLRLESLESRIVLDSSGANFLFQPELVDDLVVANATETVADDVEMLGRFKDGFVFAADDGVRGKEVWFTDGSAHGTRLVADIFPGSNSGILGVPAFVSFGDVFIVSATDGIAGEELWISDGTDEGTRLLADVKPGSDSSSPNHFVIAGNQIFFSADDGVNGRELWVTDGTTVGTHLVGDLLPGSTGSGPTSVGSFNSTAVYVVDDGATGFSLYRSDGSEDGTYLYSDLDAPGASGTNTARLLTSDDGNHFVLYGGSSPFAAYQLLEEGVQLVGVFSGSSDEFFSIGNGLFQITRPDVASPFELRDLVTGDLVQTLIQADSFLIGDKVNGRQLISFPGELWASDGTSGGTEQILAHAGQSYAFTSSFDGQSKFAFVSAPMDDLLIETDGTIAGTSIATQFANDELVGQSAFRTVGQSVLMIDKTQDQLRRMAMDFTVDSFVDLNLTPELSASQTASISESYGVGDLMFFVADLPGGDTDVLMVSKSGFTGAFPVRDSSNQIITNVDILEAANGKLYFTNLWVWSVDLSQGGSFSSLEAERISTDLVLNTSAIVNYQLLPNALMINNQNAELWAIDLNTGTANNLLPNFTTFLDKANEGSVVADGIIGELLYTSVLANGSRVLAYTDGQVVFQAGGGAFSQPPRQMWAFDDYTFLFTSFPDLWLYDGSLTQTSKIASNFFVESYAKVGTQIYTTGFFSGGVTRLYKVNTAAGTLTEVPGIEAVSELYEFDGAAWLVGSDANGDEFLWKLESAGNATQTTGPDKFVNSGNNWFYQTNSHLFFIGTDENGIPELASIDLNGNYQTITDLGSFDVSRIEVMEELLFFVKTTKEDGGELWASDGKNVIAATELIDGSGDADLNSLSILDGEVYLGTQNSPGLIQRVAIEPTILQQPMRIHPLKDVSTAFESNVVTVDNDSSTFTWRFKDGPVTQTSSGVGMESVNHTFTSFGEYTVTLEVIDKFGKSSGEVTVYDVAVHPGVFFSTPAGSTLSEGDQFSLPVSIAQETATLPYDIIVPIESNLDSSDVRLAGDGSVTIPAGDSSATISGLVVDDSIHEKDDSLIFSFGSSTEDPEGQFSHGNTLTLTLLDDDPIPTLSFVTNGLSELEEGSTAFLAELVLSSPADNDITIGLAASGTAQDQVDYSVVGNLVIPAGASRIPVTINVLNDNFSEPTESAYLEVQPNPDFTLLNNSVLSFVIPENDKSLVTFFEPTTERFRAKTGILRAKITTQSYSQLVVPIQISPNSTAVENVDFQFIDNPEFVFEPGSRVAEIRVNWLAADFSQKQLELELAPPMGTETGTFQSQLVEIVDSRKIITVDSSAPTAVWEDEQDISFPIRLTTDDQPGLNIPVSFTGTVGVNTDFTANTFFVSIPAGETEGTIELDFIDDASHTPDGALGINFGSIGGFEGTTHYVRIRNNDPLIRLSEFKPTLNVKEGESATIDVELSQASNQDV
ncbi:MAG: Calx-beta domain-containing protein, partial [Planctomycetota bacterium]